jgi:hypothetical protein
VADTPEDIRSSGDVAADDGIASAMRSFLIEGRVESFEQAVADFVRRARRQNVEIEQVVASLEAIADLQEGSRMSGAVVLDRSELRRVLLRGVLVAYYGADAVHREEGALRDRRSRQDRRGNIDGEGRAPGRADR